MWVLLMLLGMIADVMLVVFSVLVTVMLSLGYNKKD
jgi:hypothetical protein